MKFIMNINSNRKMKPDVNLVVRKGDVVEFQCPGRKKSLIGEIIKYPSNAEIVIKINPDYSVDEIIGDECYTIKKEHIIEIVTPFTPQKLEPKVRSEKEQQMIDEITIKVQIYLEELNKEISHVSKMHREAITTSFRRRVSPRAISEFNDKKLKLEKFYGKVERSIHPITGKFYSDLVSRICKMVDENCIEFILEEE